MLLRVCCRTINIALHTGSNLYMSLLLMDDEDDDDDGNRKDSCAVCQKLEAFRNHLGPPFTVQL